MFSFVMAQERKMNYNAHRANVASANPSPDRTFTESRIGFGAVGRVYPFNINWLTWFYGSANGGGS